MLFLLAPLLWSQIVVPTDYPDLAAAIAAAPPHATIVVATQVQQPRVVIDKPLTIIGDPIANIGLPSNQPCWSQPAYWKPCIELDGPGAGRVALVQVRLTRGGNCPSMQPLLLGGGFDELHLESVEAVVPLTGFDGLGYGTSAIETDVPFVLVTDSTLVGGNDQTDDFSLFEYLPLETYPAIQAPASDVTLLDSYVVGGSLDTPYGCYGCPCPELTASTTSGAGAPAVVASSLFVAGGYVVGGAGAQVVAAPLRVGGDWSDCGNAPDGPPAIAGAVHPLLDLAGDTGPIRSGASWTFGYFASGPLAVLLFDVGITPPTSLAPHGWLFVDSATAGVFGPLPTEAVTYLEFDVPSSSALVGTPLVFQVLDSTDGLTRPVARIVVP